MAFNLVIQQHSSPPDKGELEGVCFAPDLPLSGEERCNHQFKGDSRLMDYLG